MSGVIGFDYVFRINLASRFFIPTVFNSFRASSAARENISSWSLLDRLDWNLFFIWLSVLPGKSFIKEDHLFPYTQKSLTNFISSFVVHLSRQISGSSVLYQRSRHYLPILPGKPLATATQFRVPKSLTLCTSILSSS